MDRLVSVPRRILIINVSRIGDTLLATPAIRAIAQQWPEADITVLGHAKRIEVLEHLPFIARIGMIDKRSALWRGRIGGRRYDLAFVYGNDRPLLDYAFRTSSAVIAFKQKDDALNRRLLSAVEPPDYQQLHAAAMHLLLPGTLGIKTGDLHLAYAVMAAEDAWAGTTIRKDFGTAQGPLVGLQVASFPTKSYRDWPVGHFLSLCQGLLSDHPGMRFLIFGGPEDGGPTGSLHRHLNGASALYAGKLTLRQTASLMNRLDLYVGVDTGPTHIAGALRIPMVALYHCKHPARCFAPPAAENLAIIDHPALARGDCQETSSLGEIPVGDVLAACRTLLGERSRAQRRTN